MNNNNNNNNKKERIASVAGRPTDLHIYIYLIIASLAFWNPSSGLLQTPPPKLKERHGFEGGGCKGLILVGWFDW